MFIRHPYFNYARKFNFQFEGRSFLIFLGSVSIHCDADTRKQPHLEWRTSTLSCLVKKKC